MSPHTTTPTVALSSNISADGLCADLNDLNFATGEREFKRFTTLQALAALVGATLHKHISGDDQARYVASLRSVTTEFPDLESVETWLTNVTDQSNRGDI